MAYSVIWFQVSELDTGAMFNENEHQVVVASFGAKVKSRIANVIHGVDVTATDEKEIHRFLILLVGRIMKRSQTCINWVNL